MDVTKPRATFFLVGFTTTSTGAAAAGAGAAVFLASFSAAAAAVCAFFSFNALILIFMSLDQSSVTTAWTFPFCGCKPSNLPGFLSCTIFSGSWTVGSRPNSSSLSICGVSLALRAAGDFARRGVPVIFSLCALSYKCRISWELAVLGLAVALLGRSADGSRFRASALWGRCDESAVC